MVTTRSQHYRSPSPASSEGRSSDLLDVEPVVAPDEAFQPTSAWGTATRSHVLWVGSFDEMEEETRGGIRDRFSGRAGTISLQDWKIWFRTWMREKRQRNTNFNDWYAFELLPQHLEHEALQTYEQWTEAHWMELRQVERYWETRVELVSALKEGAASSLMAVPEVKSEVPEGVYVVDVEGASPGEPKDKGSAPTAASTSSPILPLSRYAQATQAALASLGAPPDF